MTEGRRLFPEIFGALKRKGFRLVLLRPGFVIKDWKRLLTGAFMTLRRKDGLMDSLLPAVEVGRHAMEGAN